MLLSDESLRQLVRVFDYSFMPPINCIQAINLCRLIITIGLRERAVCVLFDCLKSMRERGFLELVIHMCTACGFAPGNGLKLGASAAVLSDAND